VPGAALPRPLRPSLRRPVRKKYGRTLTSLVPCPMLAPRRTCSNSSDAPPTPAIGPWRDRGVVLLGSSIKVNHPEGWDAKPWVPSPFLAEGARDRQAAERFSPPRSLQSSAAPAAHGGLFPVVVLLSGLSERMWVMLSNLKTRVVEFLKAE